jgi:hypothetical protein
MSEYFIIGLLALNTIIGFVSFYYVAQWKKSQSLQVSYMADRLDDLQQKIGILGKVLKIFEDETQILQRRNEHTIKQRFRQPR